jgi:hypothetical protein
MSTIAAQITKHICRNCTDVLKCMHCIVKKEKNDVKRLYFKALSSDIKAYL